MSTYGPGYSDVTTFPEMLGKTMVAVKAERDEMVFRATDGACFRFVHRQDCCESVSIEDIIGDLSDLVGAPIVEAEEISSEGAPAPEYADSYTWTFYRFSTAKGTVTVRWLGASNGYYSESVCFEVSNVSGYPRTREKRK